MTGWRGIIQKGMRSKSMWGALAGTCIIMMVGGYALYGMLRADTQGLSFEQLRAHLTPTLLFQASLVYAFDLALAITGWVLIIGTLSGFWRWPIHARIYCINSVTRRLPGSMWYLLGRVVMYERFGISRSLTLLASGIEYVATLLGGLLVAALAWPLVLSDSQLSLFWLLAGSAAGCLLLNPPMLRTIIKRLSPQTHALNLRYRHLVGWVAFYGLVWCGGGAILFVLANALHPLPLTTLPTMIGVWSAAALLPQLLTFLPFGLGVQEITLSALLTPFMGATEAIVAALLMRVVLTLNEVLWACIAGAIRLPSVRRNTDNRAIAVAEAPPHTMKEVLYECRIEKNSVPFSDAEKPQGVSHPKPVIPPK
jgi:hypothetical protein